MNYDVTCRCGLINFHNTNNYFEVNRLSLWLHFWSSSNTIHHLIIFSHFEFKFLSIKSCSTFRQSNILPRNPKISNTLWLLNMSLEFDPQCCPACLTKQKRSYLHFRFRANYFLLPCKIPEELSRRSMLFHN